MSDPTIVLTPECTLIYPSLFEPTSFGNESEPSYRATFLLKKGADIKPMREACRQAAYKKFGTGVNLQSLKYPIRDGNEKAIDKETGKPDPTNFYYNRMFFAAKSKFQVPVVNIYNEEISENEVYGGCIVRAYIQFYGYAYMGNGVAIGLRAVCKIDDGEPLGGGKVNTGDVFKDFLKPKDTFMDQLPGEASQERIQNELGQRGDEWADPLPEDPPF